MWVLRETFQKISKTQIEKNYLENTDRIFYLAQINFFYLGLSTGQLKTSHTKQRHYNKLVECL